MKRLSGLIVLTFILVTASGAPLARAETPVSSIPLPSGVEATDFAVATDAHGYPMIAYYDGVHDDLGFVKCLDLHCIAYEQQTLDSHGDVGQYPAIVAGQGGRPIIAYRDANVEGRYISRLKLARCDDSACSQWSFSYPDIRPFNDVIDAGYGIDMLVDGEVLYISHGSKDPDAGARLVYCDLSTCDGGTEVGSVSTIATRLTLHPLLGFAVVAYSTHQGEIRIEICQQFYCAVHATTYFSEGNAVEFDIAIGATSFYLLYRDGDRSALHMHTGTYDMHSGVPTFGSGECCNLGDLDNVGPTGFSPSLRLQSGDIPVVTYHSGITGFVNAPVGVRRLECQDPRCAVPNEIRFLEPGLTIAGPVRTVGGSTDEGQALETSVWVSSVGVASSLRVLTCPAQDCGEIPPGPLIHRLSVTRHTIPNFGFPTLSVAGQGFAEGSRLLVNGKVIGVKFPGSGDFTLIGVIPLELVRYGFLSVVVENSPPRRSQKALIQVGTTRSNINGDNRVDGVDVLLLMRRLGGLEEDSTPGVPNDVNQDGQFTIADVVLVRRVVAGLGGLDWVYPPFPWETW